MGIKTLDWFSILIKSKWIDLVNQSQVDWDTEWDTTEPYHLHLEILMVWKKLVFLIVDEIYKSLLEFRKRWSKVFQTIALYSHPAYQCIPFQK